jgi:hypothetical protein
MFDEQKIKDEGLVWKKRFESDFMFNDAPEKEEPYFLPTIFSNSGKLSKSTNKVMDAMEQTIKYL